MIISIQDFFRLREQLPVVDVRSEGEFESGHIPAAVNIPLLNNQERIEVGTDYKQKGQMEAIKTGFRLVGPRLYDIINEAQQIASERELLVHCWRGGMRSSNFSQFIGMAGVKSHTLLGGYKAYRTLALESYEKQFQFVLITGFTGSGKSELLRALKKLGEQALDLEMLARHKGSAFGHLLMPSQPSTEQFQNELFEEIRKLDINKRIWVEDESIALGKIFLPTEFWKSMQKSPLVQLIVPKEIRIQRLVNEYGLADREEFLEIMGKITKKLGGQNYAMAREKLSLGDMASTIDILLSYYDKAYLQSIERRRDSVQLKIDWDGKEIMQLASEVINRMKKADENISSKGI